MAKKRNKKGRKGEENSNKERQKLIVEMEKQKKHTAILLTSVIIVVVLAVIIAIYALGSTDDSSQNTVNENTNNQETEDEIKIPISSVDDGELHYFTENDIKFYVHKNPNGSFKTRISLCEPCDGKTFTLKEDGTIIDCDVCHTQWDSETYEGLSGGCQDYPPSFLRHEIIGDNITVKKSDLK